MANTPQIVSISGLNPGTCYKLYIVVKYSEEEIVVVDPIDFETTNRYTYTFDTDGGSTIEPMTQDAGSEVNAPSHPTKTGYTFLGWNLEVPTVMGSENLTFTALWQINSYVLTLNCCGAESVINSNVVYNELAPEPEEPTRVGYTFNAWYKEVGLINLWDFSTQRMPANNVTLYAKWIANTDTAYRVEHYQQNILDDEYTLVETENLQGTTQSSVSSLSKDFDGFDENVSHVDRVVSGTIAADGSLVLKRFYDRNVYTVVFKDWDETEVASMTYRHGSSLDLPEDLTREGYTFDGWDHESDVVTSNLVINAQYLFNPIAELDVSDDTLNLEVEGLDDAIEFSHQERQLQAIVKLQLTLFNDLVLPEDIDILNNYITNTLKITSSKTLLMDISLFKIVGEEQTKLTESLNQILISFLVPAEFHGKDFKLVHIHGGEAHLLDFDYDTETHMVSFTIRSEERRVG